MSIATEVARLQAAKAALKSSINAKGGTVADETLDDYAAQVDDITVVDFLDPLSTPASAGHILAPKEAYSDQGDKIDGTMPNNADNDVEVTDLDGELIPEGYYDGTGSAVLSVAEAAKVVTGNIKSGITLLGVAGKSTVVDTADATATADKIKVGKTAYGSAGTKLTGTRYFWLEDYATQARYMFVSAILPETVIISIPNCIQAQRMFQEASGVKTVVLTFSNDIASLSAMFISCTSVETITLNFNTANVTVWDYFASTNLALTEITEALDLSSASNVTGMFNNCSALVTISFIANSIPISLSLSASPLLSDASLASIVNGCLEGAVAKTLTVHATSAAIMEALKGDVTGGAGTYLFTANAGGAVDLADFVRDTKGWSIAL
jgi:hypothetical protein